MKKNTIQILTFFFTISFASIASADMQIIKEGQIIAKKLYTNDEVTLVVNNSNKTYVCSIIGAKTTCILSKKTSLLQ